MPLTTEIILHFYFPFKVFPENFTERERARARACTVRRSPARSRACTVRRSQDRVCRRERKIRDRDRHFARSRRRSRSCLCEIAPSIAIRIGFVVGLDLGCGLCFSGFVFSFFFSKHQKYFPENFLKCNQTHGNIFLFRKLAFPENMYFPKNVLRQPNTA